MSSVSLPNQTQRRPSTGFRFKQFSIKDDRCAHKVGTDGTLLGAWTKVEHATGILDIGTGSGLIALMLAQRATPETKIEAVELSKHDYHQAVENVKHSPWAKKIKVHHLPVQQFQIDDKFNCIVSNPPYFNNSFKPPNESRIASRHTDTLSFEELLTNTKRLLTGDGKLSVILPYTEGLQFIDLAKVYSLFLTRQWSFRTRIEKPIERWLLEFSGISSSLETGEILLYNKEDEWSAEYKLLTRDFYLKL